MFTVNATILTLLFHTSCTSPEPKIFDIHFLNGNIHTPEGIEEELFIKNGIVQSPTGDFEATQIIDLEGKTIFPSFHDSHTHLLAGSFVLDKLQVLGVNSMAGLQRKVQSYVETAPDVPWIIGYGWIKTGFDNPDGRALDTVSGDYPVAIFDSAGHSLLINSVAMAAIGLDEQSPDVENGIIHRDSDGFPTGFLQEAAIEMVSPFMISQFTFEELGANLQSQIAEFHSGGITSASEILAVPGVNLSFPEIYHSFKDLNFRISYSIPIFRLDDLTLLEVYLNDQSQWVQFNGAKVWVDGSAGSGESWSLEESDIEEGHYGSHYFERDELIEIIQHAEQNHYDIKFHVNGDAAVKTTLDALEYINQEIGSLSQQYIFEHAVLIAPEDYDRLHNLGIVLSVQPPHALVGIYGDQADHWREERLQWAWDFPALESNGLPIVIGTDWPVWPTADGLTNWNTATQGLGERNLQRDTLSSGYTTLGRKIANIQNVGLSIGQQADFIVLNGDPTTENIQDLEVLETWISGHRVYKK